MKKRYKNLLVSGCSFSANGQSGLPPTATSSGGCSFKEDPDYQVAQPLSWPGFVAQQLMVDSLVNTASCWHGNILIANSILECLNRFQYRSDDTLVLMNISEPSRLDLPCAYDHPEVDYTHIPWNNNLIPYSYFKKNLDSKIIPKIEKNVGLEQVEQLTSNYVEFLFNFLENRRIDFYFLTMTNFDDSCLHSVLNKFDSHWIKLTPGPSMYEYCRQTGTCVSDSDYHPNKLAHKQISNIVYNHINAQSEIHLSVL